jgi:hypothetical protein
MNNKINLSPMRFNLYADSEKEVAGVLSKCYSRKCTSCQLISEPEIDKLIPPYVTEINIRQVVDRQSKGLNRTVKENIDEMFPNKPEEFRARLASLVEDIIAHRLAGTPSPLLQEGHLMQPLPPNQDLVVVDKYHISDIVGIIGHKMNVENAEDAFKKDLRKLIMFTAMGCYGNSIVSLCPSRIEASAKALGVNENILAEVVWIHEEMHSLMNSNVKGEISEHIVQSMTAAALDKLGMNRHLDAMVELASNQPDAYAFFAQDPNAGLLSSRTMLTNIPPPKKPTPSVIVGSNPKKAGKQLGALKSMTYKGEVIRVNHLYEVAVKLAECMIREDRSRFINNVLSLGNDRPYFSNLPASFGPSHQVSGENIYFHGSRRNTIANIMEQMLLAFGDNPRVMTLNRTD